MKKLVDLNIGKIEFKKFSKELNKLVYSYNDIIERYSKTILTKEEAEDILDCFINIGIYVKNNDLPFTRIKEEILKQIRTHCKTLKQYIKEFKYTEDDINDFQKLINYNVANYIRAKKQEKLNPVTITKHLQYQKRTAQAIKEFPFNERLNLKSFKEMNKELINMYVTNFKIK